MENEPVDLREYAIKRQGQKVESLKKELAEAQAVLNKLQAPLPPIIEGRRDGWEVYTKRLLDKM